ncbi:MAG TPA: type VI secretion system tip protein TssI/VgrG, partial [Lysobacter sp.]|nr:type VI secretion system tip protein TssI/VgrG [Lysobacter sp.]
MAIGGLGGGSDHVMSIKTTAGKDKLLVLRMEGRESLGRLPEYRVEVVGNVDMMGNHEEIDVHALLGTRANVTVDLFNEPRQFNGFIVKMQRGERHGRYKAYTIIMRPWLWFATRTRNSMVFQNKSVKEVVTEVLQPYSTDSEWRLEMASVYTKLDYVVQYDETDFDFVSRLLEEHGIYYFFEHTDTKHTMVLIDAVSKHKSKKNTDKLKWANSLKEHHSITNWLVQEEVRSVKATVRDYDYLASATKIEQNKSAKPTDATSKLGTAEVYEFPADVVQNQIKPDAQPATSAATQRAKVLMERLFSAQKTGTGTTNAHDVAAGMTFEIEEEGGGLLGGLMGGSDSGKAGKYLVISASYRLEFADHEAIEDLKSIKRRRDGFVADVVAIDVDGAPFRPDRSTPRPVIAGPQTAVVVGASGNEIETDKHGRVKIQFHW